MIECPPCRRTERQNRAGKTGSGSQRYRCLFFHVKYTPDPIRPFLPGSRRWKGTSDSPSLGEKQQIFVLTLVDRLTRPLLGFRVVWQRSQEVIQEMVDEGAGDIRG